MLQEKRLDQIHGKIDGPLTLERHTSLHGMVMGDVTVPAGIRLDHHGLITGDLVVEATGAAVVHGMVAGAVINAGGTVQVFGRSARSRIRVGARPTSRPRRRSGNEPSGHGPLRCA